MRKIQILDTTLRDGEQAPGMAISPAQKVYLASVLDSLGVDVIELGFPAASQRDFESVSSACKSIIHATSAALARATEFDIDIARQALHFAKRKRLHLTMATSPIHMEKKLRMTPENVIRMAVKGVKYAGVSFDSIEMGAEDATRADPLFLTEFFCAVTEAGADVINIADTVGCARPEEFGMLIKTISDSVPAVKNGKANISVHCHNDLGLALANTIAGIEAGASQAETSLLGLGERAGNAALEELLAFLHVKSDIVTSVKNNRIGAALKEAAALFNMPPARNKAIAGANAFSHSSGIHQNGVLKEPRSYEILSAKEFGIEPGGMIISRHSGRAGITARLKKLAGAEIEADIAESLIKIIETVSADKKMLSDTDLLLIMQDNGLYTGIVYFLDEIEVMTVNESATAKYRTYVKLSTRGGTKTESLSEGVSSFEAIFGAIEKAAGVGFKVTYFSFSAAGRENECTSSFYLEALWQGKTERAESYSDDLYKAAALACLDIANRINTTVKKCPKQR